MEDAHAFKTDTWPLKQAKMPYCQALLFLGGGGGGGGGGEGAHSGL